MAVLNNVGEEWRLFWVLQAIGSSSGLAVLVVKLTGSGENTVNDGDRCESSWMGGRRLRHLQLVVHLVRLPACRYSGFVVDKGSFRETEVFRRTWNASPPFS